jgi:hypothetical protein
MNHKGHFMLTHAITADPGREFAAEVRAGITKAGRKNCLPNICMTMSDRRSLKSSAFCRNTV